MTGSRAYVPVLWLYEVVAVLAKTEPFQSTATSKARPFLEDLRSLDIIIDATEIGNIFGDVYGLALKYRISGYDAAYLELALRKQLPLASLDDELNKAASAVGVALIQIESSKA